jgi:hypothetical protein
MHTWFWREKLKKETTLTSKLKQADDIKIDVKYISWKYME